MSNSVLVMKHSQLPDRPGIYYRLTALTGSLKGDSFILLGNRIVIGRSETVEISIKDNKASREHSEITKVGDNWVLTDLMSQNGTILNDKKISQAEIKNGDKIIIGQTVFKFSKVDVSDKPPKKIEEVAKSNRKNRILFLLIFLGLGFFLMPDDSNVKKNKKPNTTNLSDANNEYLQAVEKKQAKENKDLKNKLNSIYQRGLRELREKNYYRAIHEFNLALVIAPGDPHAEYYLRKTKEELDREIEAHLLNAKRSEDSIKYLKSIVSYCAIIRLLYNFPEDQRYKNAEKQIRELETKIGLNPSETDCLKKQRTTD